MLALEGRWKIFESGEVRINPPCQASNIYPFLLLTWPMAKRLKLFGDYIYLVGKISRSNFLGFQGPKWLSEINIMAKKNRKHWRPFSFREGVIRNPHKF